MGGGTVTHPLHMPTHVWLCVSRVQGQGGSRRAARFHPTSPKEASKEAGHEEGMEGLPGENKRGLGRRCVNGFGWARVCRNLQTSKRRARHTGIGAHLPPSGIPCRLAHALSATAGFW